MILCKKNTWIMIWKSKYLGAMPEFISFKPLVSPFICRAGSSFVAMGGVQGIAEAFVALLKEVSSCLFPPIPKWFQKENKMTLKWLASSPVVLKWHPIRVHAGLQGCNWRPPRWSNINLMAILDHSGCGWSLAKHSKLELWDWNFDVYACRVRTKRAPKSSTYIPYSFW